MGRDFEMGLEVGFWNSKWSKKGNMYRRKDLKTVLESSDVGKANGPIIALK